MLIRLKGAHAFYMRIFGGFGHLRHWVSATIYRLTWKRISLRPGRGSSVRFGSVIERKPTMDTIKPLFTATATAVGGRNGHAESSDRIVAVDLSVPKEMGGPGKPGTATPEHLFAAGYAACFGGAIDFVAKKEKKGGRKAIVTCAVSIGPRDGGGFGLSIEMHVKDKSMKQAELAAF